MLGLALWTYYQQAPGAGPLPGDAVFPFFINQDLPDGVRGLFLAAILAAAMSSLDSALNALATVSISDIYLPWSKRNIALDMDEDTSDLVGSSQMLSVFWGLALTLAAIGIGLIHQRVLADTSGASDLSRNKELLSLALGVMSLLYGPLLGVFVLAIFTTRGTSRQVLFAMTSGLLSVLTVKFVFPDAIGWTWHVVFGFGITFLLGFVEISSGRVRKIYGWL
jgi:Na+/proline symporter